MFHLFDFYGFVHPQYIAHCAIPAQSIFDKIILFLHAKVYSKLTLQNNNSGEMPVSVAEYFAQLIQTLEKL